MLLLNPFYIQTCWNIQLRLLMEEDNLVDLSAFYYYYCGFLVVYGFDSTSHKKTNQISKV